MKHIVKGDEPKELEAWKSLTNDDWIPTYEDLRRDTKAAVKTALMREQGNICCYCESRLREESSHIEHFRPQSDPEVDPLDFGNLLCSCQGRLKKRDPRHCGNLKGDWFGPGLISPFSPECEKRFKFLANGTIIPANREDQAAIETIERLGLSLPKLNSKRASAIEPFLDENLSLEELEAFVKGYLRRDANTGFGEFWTTIRDVFGSSITYGSA